MIAVTLVAVLASSVCLMINPSARPLPCLFFARSKRSMQSPANESQFRPRITIADGEIEWTAIRAQGAGGQNVNKVSSAVHLRFDIAASSLPAAVKARLLASTDQRVTSAGVVIIKAQRYRTLERNRDDALARLRELIDAAARVPRLRKPTKPTKGSQRRRVDSKVKRGQIKATRGKVVE
jgi:ribosome-associated protein